MTDYREADFSRLKTVPIAQRPNKVDPSLLAHPPGGDRTFAAFWDSLPDVLAARDARELARLVARAAGRRGGVAMLGGHVINVGLGPLLVTDDTTTWKPDFERGFFQEGGAVAWKFAEHTSGTAGGHRPGGPGRRARTNTAGRRPGTEPVVVFSIGTAGARSVEISAPDLDRSQCQQIHDQLRIWANAWEYEVATA